MVAIKELFTEPLRKLFIELFLEAAKNTPGVGGIVNAGDKLLRGLIAIEREEREKRLINYAKGLASDYNENIEFWEEDILSVMRKTATCYDSYIDA